MSDFSRGIANFANRTNRTLEHSCKAIKISLFIGIVMDTRVDTGRMRGNWQTTEGTPAGSDIERFAPEDEPEKLQVVLNEIKTAEAFSLTYLTNNVEYVGIWEERDGMVAKNMARIDRMMSEVAHES